MLLVLVASLVQLSCQSSTKPSVLVIAVDDLSVLDVLCNEEEESTAASGIEILCKESVRFTHAFNTSPISVPTLASILTGVYPFQHKVRNNGAPGLDASFVTVAEKALESKYRTAFFSGGPPVWRKSGLNQGFELFDDAIIPGRQSLYRNLGTTSKQLLQWIKHEVGSSSSFFAMIYVPDLIFTNTVTQNEFGEARNLSHESQLDELDANLFNLFRELKNQNRWDNTTVVVVGLNGHTDDDRPGELSPNNLHSENTQVALFIKPQQKARDEALQWKIDRNVSLVDLGQTLFDLVGTTKNPNKTSFTFPTYSLSRVLHKAQPDWPENRLILLESDWAQWRGLSGRRHAVLDSHTLFLYDDPIRIFNTLTDRLETNTIRVTELPTGEKIRIVQALNEIGAQPWQGLDKSVIRKYSPAFFRWLRSDQKASLLRDLKSKALSKEPDPDVLRWAALLAFDLKEWNMLKTIGVKANVPLWQFVADRNGASGPTVNFSFFQDPCLRLLEIPQFDSTDLKKCDNPLFLDFIDWQRSDIRSLSKGMQKRRFERAYLTSLIDQDIQEAGLATTLIWDLSLKNTLGPKITDLVLGLPEYQKQRANLYKALQNSAQWQEED
ncbi:MAG: sulfatase-like hydrolase/transferase [Bdellovibrionaceae bacterium]|nr:sulfatase-like hydrolase/transferase [Pseudobdellovibrionaceae bacterium]